MLKLEKTSNSSGLAISLRERDGFFEPRLLKALAIALFFHVAALILFHATPFYFSSNFTFPPIQVQTDSPVQGISAHAALDREEEEFSPPPLSFVPDLDWISFSQTSSLIPSLSLDIHAFQQMEEKIRPQWQEPLALKLEEPRIQLAISGDLAHLSLIASDPLLQQMQPMAADRIPTFITYQVQLDQRTGELFWYDRIESSDDPAINQLTEKILLKLRFSSPDQLEVIKGNLHFVVLNQAKGNPL